MKNRTTHDDDQGLKEAELDEEKKVMLQEIAMQPDFVRDNVDSMLAATRARARRAPEAGASGRAS